MQDLEFHYEGPKRFAAYPRQDQLVSVAVHCPTGLTMGTRLRVVLGRFRSFRDGGREAPPHWRLDSVLVENAGDMRGAIRLVHGPPVDHHDLARARVQESDMWRVELAHVLTELRLPPLARIRLHFSARLSPHAGFDAHLQLEAMAPNGVAFHRIGRPYRLRNEPGPVVRLEVRGKPTPQTARGLAATVFATDALLNPIPRYRETVWLSAEPDALALPEQVTLTPAHRGRFALTGLSEPVSQPADDAISPATPATRYVNARDPKAQLVGRSNPMLDGPLLGYTHHFGDLHFHSEISVDGDRELKDAYTYARDVLNLDVAAVTDRTPEPKNWMVTQYVNQAFNEAGRFVTLPAWEWNTTRGHANVYLRSIRTEAGPDVPKAFGVNHPARHFWPDDAILMPQLTNAHSEHTREDGSPQWETYDWARPNERIRLVEIVQSRGSFEADIPDPRWRIHEGGHKASVQDALRRGLRIGFTGGSDNRAGYPTRDPRRPGEYAGLTGFLLPQGTPLNRASIWAAMNNRRTYATSGVPMIAHFAVNGHVMGAEGKWTPGTPVTFTAALYASEPFVAVEVVSEGETVWSAEPNTDHIRLTDEVLPDPIPHPTEPGEAPDVYRWYYLRARTADGHVLLTSPVWLDQAE